MATQVGLFLYSNVQISLRLHHGFRYLAPAVAAWGRVSGRRGLAALAFKEVPQYLAVVLSCVVFLFCVSGVFLYLTLSLNGRGTVHALSRDRSAESAGTP